jgi:hypothetical protein
MNDRSLASLVLGVLTASSGGCGLDSGDGTGPDGAVGAADGCATWYRDDDADGHGDPSAPQVACARPEGHVTSSDDCDDRSRFVHPGHPEVCDQLDNDCDPLTAEACRARCEVKVRESGHRYLFCKDAVPWHEAEDICELDEFDLVRVDDQAENEYLSTAAASAFRTVDQFWAGGSDSGTEGQWTWEADAIAGEFWTGGSTADVPPGQGNGDVFASWNSTEPDHDTESEDCLAVTSLGTSVATWSDEECVRYLPFVCERY